MGEGAEHDSTGLDRPDFVEVADRRAKLQLHAFAVGIRWIHDVRPVEAARPETSVTCRSIWNGVWLRYREFPLALMRCGGATPTPPICRQLFRDALRPRHGFCSSAQGRAVLGILPTLRRL